MELLHRRRCGLDVHKETVVVCLWLVSDGKVTTEVRAFQNDHGGPMRGHTDMQPVPGEVEMRRSGFRRAA